MRARRACLFTGLLLLLSGCAVRGAQLRRGSGVRPGEPSAAAQVRAPDPRAPAHVSAADAEMLRGSNAEFAGRLLALLAETHPTVVLSPFSVSEALAMLYPGARGETAAQLAGALSFRLPAERLAAAFNAADQALAAVSGHDATVNLANTLFGQRAYPFHQPFLALLAREYGAGIHTVDFSQAPAEAIRTINAWVSEHTHAKIQDLLSPQEIDQLTRLVLVNAVYLHAHWLMPFAKADTSPAPFHSPTGTVTVPTMHQTAVLPYRRGAGYQALELPYRGGRLALDILVPDLGELSPLLKRLSDSNPLELVSGLQRQAVQLSLPKLELRTRVGLAPALSKLGMPLAFIPGRADLSGIGGRPGDLYVKAVVHETYLRVDEAGTEAAAATAVVVRAVSLIVPQVVVDVDRPFVFLVRDLQTDAILFIGTVTQP